MSSVYKLIYMGHAYAAVASLFYTIVTIFLSLGIVIFVSILS